MEIVSALIDMSVGVTDGRTAVGEGAADVWVAVGRKEFSVAGETVGVDKTLTEKLQASSTSALNRKTSIDKDHLRCFIAFSLSAVANGNFQ
jgi:hypothetical protein